MPANRQEVKASVIARAFLMFKLCVVLKHHVFQSPLSVSEQLRGVHEPDNEAEDAHLTTVRETSTILATGVFTSAELYRLSKGISNDDGAHFGIKSTNSNFLLNNSASIMSPTASSPHGHGLLAIKLEPNTQYYCNNYASDTGASLTGMGPGGQLTPNSVEQSSVSAHNSHHSLSHVSQSASPSNDPNDVHLHRATKRSRRMTSVDVDDNDKADAVNYYSHQSPVGLTVVTSSTGAWSATDTHDTSRLGAMDVTDNDKNDEVTYYGHPSPVGLTSSSGAWSSDTHDGSHIHLGQIKIKQEDTGTVKQHYYCNSAKDIINKSIITSQVGDGKSSSLFLFVALTAHLMCNHFTRFSTNCAHIKFVLNCDGESKGSRTVGNKGGREDACVSNSLILRKMKRTLLCQNTDLDIQIFISASIPQKLINQQKFEQQRLGFVC